MSAPFANAHKHELCDETCRGRGWCFGRACSFGADGKALEKCLICRRRERAEAAS